VTKELRRFKMPGEIIMKKGKRWAKDLELACTRTIHIFIPQCLEPPVGVASCLECHEIRRERKRNDDKNYSRCKKKLKMMNKNNKTYQKLILTVLRN